MAGPGRRREGPVGGCIYYRCYSFSLSLWAPAVEFLRQSPRAVSIAVIWQYTCEISTRCKQQPVRPPLGGKIKICSSCCSPWRSRRHGPTCVHVNQSRAEATSHGPSSYLQGAAALGDTSHKRTTSTNHRAVTPWAMATAMSLARRILQLEGNPMGVGAGFFSAAAVASAASNEGAACPAYPWPQDGAQGGRKVFMQSDCAACHSMLPYAGLREAAPGEAEAKVAEIVVVNEDHPAAARPLQSATDTPDLTGTTKMLEGLRRNNLYTAQELNKKMALPTPVWLQFLQPYMRAPQTV